MRDLWTQLQRQLYQETISQVRSHLRNKPRALVRYEQKFLADQKSLRPTSPAHFEKALNQSDVAFMGDFHTLRQSQRFVLRQLRSAKIRKPDFLCFEVLKKSDLSLLQSWLRQPSEAAETKLRKALRLDEKWGASFDTYKELFKLCSRMKIEIVALATTKKTLRDRDRAASKIIAELQGRVWVLMGEYHCARPHLPALIQKLRPRTKMIVVQQNDDRATLRYLDQLSGQKPLYLADLASLDSKSKIPLFCVLHTPLWIKWQSYLQKHLHTPDDPFDRLQEMNIHEQVVWCVQTLLQFFKDPRYTITKREKDLLDLEVFSSEDPLFYKSIDKLQPKDKKEILKQLKRGSIAILADQRRIYLSEVTLNSCSQAAGQLLYQSLSKIDISDAHFFKLTLVESISYLLSKLLNHSRKTLKWRNWILLSRAGVRKNEARAVLKTRDFNLKYQSRKSWIGSLKPFTNESAVALGRILAEGVFEAFLTGEFSQARLHRIMTHEIRSEEEAFEILAELKSIASAFTS